MSRIGPFWVYPVIALVASVFFQLQNIDGPLLDFHSFRQTHTAITTYWYIQEGIKFPYLIPIFGWPWSVPFEFPLYQMIVLWVSELFKISNLDYAGRIVSMGFYYATFVPLYLMLKNLGVKVKSIAIVLTVVLVMPIFIFWSRTFMIESMALFFSIMCVYLVLKYEQGKNNFSVILLFILIFSVLAALVKITTFIVAILFLTYYILGTYKLTQVLTIRTAAVFILFLASIVVGMFWTEYADSIKAMNPLSAGITSKNLTNWNFGTLEQRLSPYSYYRMMTRAIENTGPVLLGLLLGLWFFRSKNNRLILLGLLTYISAFLIFFNLYYVHNYYWYASSIFLAISLGLLLSNIIRKTRNHYLQHLLMVLIICGSFFSYYLTYYARQEKNLDGHKTMVIANFLKTNTNSGDLVYIKGMNWSSEVPYYSQRKSIMISRSGTIDINNKEFDGLYEKSIDEGRVGALVLCGKNIDENARLKYFGIDNPISIVVADCKIIAQR